MSQLEKLQDLNLIRSDKRCSQVNVQKEASSWSWMKDVWCRGRDLNPRFGLRFLLRSQPGLQLHPRGRVLSQAELPRRPRQD